MNAVRCGTPARQQAWLHITCSVALMTTDEAKRERCLELTAKEVFHSRRAMNCATRLIIAHFTHARISEIFLLDSVVV